MISFPKLNDKQLEKLSDISSDVALVALASVVLPATFDKFNMTMILLGLTIACALWMFSMWLRN